MGLGPFDLSSCTFGSWSNWKITSAGIIQFPSVGSWGSRWLGKGECIKMQEGGNWEESNQAICVTFSHWVPHSLGCLVLETCTPEVLKGSRMQTDEEISRIPWYREYRKEQKKYYEVVECGCFYFSLTSKRVLTYPHYSFPVCCMCCQYYAC